LSATIIGVYYLAFFAGNNLVGWIGGFLEKMPRPNSGFFTQPWPELPGLFFFSPAKCSVISSRRAITHRPRDL